MSFTIEFPRSSQLTPTACDRELWRTLTGSDFHFQQVSFSQSVSMLLQRMQAESVLGRAPLVVFRFNIVSET